MRTLERINVLFFIVLFLFVFSPPIFAAGIYIPKGWVEGKLPNGMFGFHTTDDTEGIGIGFSQAVSSDPVSELHQAILPGRKKGLILKVFNGKTDTKGTMAQCELIEKIPSQHNIQKHLKILLIKNSRRKVYLVVITFAKVSLYPKVEKTLDRVRASILTYLATAKPSKKVVVRSRIRQVDPRTIPFKAVNAGLYWIKIPVDWQVVVASGEQFQARNQRGETAFIYSLQVPGDPQTYQFTMQGYQMMGYSPQQLQLLSRIYAPYLSPVQVIQRFYPQIVPTVLGMQILSAQRVALRGNAALITYRYTLRTPKGNIPYEGSALVNTIPAAYPIPGANFWTLIAQGAEAPTPLFQKNFPVYVAIFKSAQINQQGLQAYLQNQQQQNQIINQMIQSQNQAFWKRQNEINQAGETVKELQYQTFETWQNAQYHNALGWMETYQQETPVYDTVTGARMTLPNSYIDFFKDRGEPVRSGWWPWAGAGNGAPYGTYSGDVLKTVPVGSW